LNERKKLSIREKRARGKAKTIGKKSENERRKAKGARRKAKGERRKAKGERWKVKGERRKVKGERRKAKGERRKIRKSRKNWKKKKRIKGKKSEKAKWTAEKRMARERGTGGVEVRDIVLGEIGHSVTPLGVDNQRGIHLTSSSSYKSSVGRRERGREKEEKEG
jgi:hypothetical protein